MNISIELIIFSPITIFFISLTFGYLLYRLGGRAAPKLKDVGYKLKTYTGGEELPLKIHKPSFHFFHLALLFTVLHVAAIYLTTVVVGITSIFAIIYLIFMFISIIVLMKR